MSAISLYRRCFPGEGYTNFHDELRRRMPASGSVLDLGCGDHRLLAPWRTGNRQVWGADFEPHPDMQERRWFRGLEKEGKIPFPDGTFDLIASQWVLEHVAAPTAFLEEVARVLRPGGCFISLTVNRRHYIAWLARLFHLFPHDWTQKLIYRLYRRAHHDTFPTYYRMNTLSHVNEAARAVGLQVGGSRFYACPGYFSFSSVLLALSVLVDRTLEEVWPTLGRIYWVVSLRKPASEEWQSRAA